MFAHFSSAKKISVWRSLITASFIVALNNISKPAQANLSLAPTYLQLEAENVQTTGFLSIGNTGDSPMRVSILPTAFTYDENGQFIRQETGSEWDITSYLRLAPREMTIPAQSSRNVRFAAILPPSLADGEYRVAIFAETLSESNPNLDDSEEPAYRVNFLTRIGSAVYISKGDTASDLQILGATFNPETEELRLQTRNQGTATAKAQITWQLSQNGETVIQGFGGNSFLPNHQLNALLSPEKDYSWSGIFSNRYQLTGELTWQEETLQVLPFSFDIEI